MINQFVAAIAPRFEQDAEGLVEVIQALNKLVFLDMHCVVDSYLESKNEMMRAILRRATRFTQDATTQSENIINSEQALAESLHGIATLTNELDAPVMDEVLERARELAVDVKKLEARLGELMLGDHLYIADRDDRSEGTFLDRIKHFVERHLHGSS